MSWWQKRKCCICGKWIEYERDAVPQGKKGAMRHKNCHSKTQLLPSDKERYTTWWGKFLGRVRWRKNHRIGNKPKRR